MNTVGTPLLWGGFAVVVVIMLSIDLLLQGRRGAHAMSMKQAAGWSILWVTLSLLFNAAFWCVTRQSILDKKTCNSGSRLVGKVIQN